MSLKGKHALITGSSRGIGRGIALKLAQEGVRVGVHYYQNEAAARDTLAKVRERGSDGFVVQADVSRPDEVKRMFDKVRAEFHTLLATPWRFSARPRLLGSRYRLWPWMAGHR
jgi:NAD(P)-dependent dehydrogenase (short-subunit alcohol dehydrogenase family)